MVGTENEEDLDRASIVLNGMGKKIFSCGGPGTGQIAKISNNMILGIQMCAISEGLALGEKLGINAKTLVEIMSVSTSSCWALTGSCPIPDVIETAPSSKNYKGGFQTSLITKDLALALEIANEVNAKVDFGEKAIEYFSTLEKNGYGGKDFGIVYQYIFKNLKM
jgi:3-hydroxyisobutyrate dehydrogenase